MNKTLIEHSIFYSHIYTTYISNDLLIKLLYARSSYTHYYCDYKINFIIIFS